MVAASPGSTDAFVDPIRSMEGEAQRLLSSPARNGSRMSGTVVILLLSFGVANFGLGVFVLWRGDAFPGLYSTLLGAGYLTYGFVRMWWSRVIETPWHEHGAT